MPVQVKNGIVRDDGKVRKDGTPVLRGKYGIHALRHAAASLSSHTRLDARASAVSWATRP
jgi:hypothetical protein